MQEEEMEIMKKKAALALGYAFPKTIPVMVGYVFLGMAYGILMRVNGYGVFWALAMSLFVYAGSLQYMGVTRFIRSTRFLWG